MRFRVIVSGWLVAVASAGVLATPIELQVMTPSSNVDVQLCLLGNCDSDTSSVSGFVQAKVSPLSSPLSLQLYDFNFLLNDQIDLFISFGFLGSFTGTGTGIQFVYPTPGTPQPPTVVTAGSFNYLGVPSNGAGLINYSSTGIVCNAIMQSGRPCNGVIDLAAEGAGQTGNIAGTVSVSPERLVTLTLNPTMSGPIDPDNPSLGTLTVTGTIVATATAPLLGDANLDGGVDARDIESFLGVLLNPGGATWQGRFSVDMNDDDAFDMLDVDVFAACLVSGGSCG